MNRKCEIYAIIHIASGKRYVGSTSDQKSRWAHHKSHLRHRKHHCAYLQNAWNKYGEYAFEFVVLETLEVDTKEARVFAELRHISSQPCYNSRIAGISFTNFVNAPIVRERISKSLSAKLRTDEVYRELLASIGAKLAAHARTPEARAKMSKQAKQLWKKNSHRAVISAKLAKHWDRPGVREEHSERVKLIKNTPEARLRNSEITTLRWADPNGGLRNRKQTRWADPKAREIQAAKMRASHAKRRLERTSS